MRSEYEEVVIKESVEEVKVGSVEKVKVEVEVKVTKKSRKGKEVDRGEVVEGAEKGVEAEGEGEKKKTCGHEGSR